MTTQPTALRLADALEQDYCSCHEGFKTRNRIDPQCESCQTKDWRNEAAAELRRLHAENQELREANAEFQAWFELEAGQLKRAVAAEREACAKVCDDKVDAEYATGKVDHNEMGWTQACAIAIRARGQQ